MTIQITNKSNDKGYFTIVPRLVWAIARNPYDFTLWAVIKDIAGENGECRLTRDELATLAMMSPGQVTKSRDFLLELGLLQGQRKKVEKKPQPVWHLTVPDIWHDNQEFCHNNRSIQDRLRVKKQASPHDAYSEQASPPDVYASPHDAYEREKRATIMNLKNNKEEQEPLSPEDQAKKRIKDALHKGLESHTGFDVSHFPEDVRPFVKVFCDLWNMAPPRGSKAKRGEYAHWVTSFRDLKDSAGEFGTQALRSYRDYFENYMASHQGIAPHTVNGPQSLIRGIRGHAAEMRTRTAKMNDDPVKAQYAEINRLIKEEGLDPNAARTRVTGLDFLEVADE